MTPVKQYEAIIIGGGGGLKLRPISNLGHKIAIIEKEALGGTCLNRGCIPSKMLIHPADVLDEVKTFSKWETPLSPKINFGKLIQRVTEHVSSNAQSIATAYDENPNVDFYHGHGRFLEDKVIEVNGEKITANRIFIGTGARPSLPKIEGLEGTPYMTSREALRNTVLPKKMLVIGSGYIGAELGYFYQAMGAQVEFIVRSRFLKQEDREIADEFTKAFRKRCTLHMGWTPQKVEYSEEQFSVTVENKAGETQILTADALLVATGIVPNTDQLGLENTGIQTDEKGFVAVDDHLATTVPGVYALGDVTGRYFFRHSVNFEGEYLLRVLYQNPGNEAIEYPPMPHAVFSNPQIGAVGKTEEQLKEEGIDYTVGMNHYKDSAMGGDVLESEYGLAKLLFDRNTHKLLGAHIIGKEASNMIHMLIAYLTLGATFEDMQKMIYIHPALPEVVRNALRKVEF